MSGDAPVVRLANIIISKAIGEKASDIHIEPGREQLRVRFRTDGILTDAMLLPKRAMAPLTSRFKIMAEMDIAEKRAPQDGRISANVEGKPYDFRVSTLPAVFGEKIVMRVLDKSSINVGLNKLGFLPHTMEMFEQMITRTYGIILVTGPTGSGKSTTLYSALAKLNSGDKNILTVEDPVEYELAGITQAQVNVRANMTFANALRAMLRQDPNIIMVGEIRDSETALIAIEAALTGHLVLSTLHTNDAPGAVARLLDMGVESFLIASSIPGVLAQRLLRTICPKCKEPYTPPMDAVKRLGMNVDLIGKSDITFYRGRGCDHLQGHRLQGTRRRVRADAGDREGARIDSGAGVLLRDSRGGQRGGDAVAQGRRDGEDFAGHYHFGGIAACHLCRLEQLRRRASGCGAADACRAARGVLRRRARSAWRRF